MKTVAVSDVMLRKYYSCLVNIEYHISEVM